MAFVEEHLQSFDFNQNYENVTYEDVITTDRYRPSRPYKLLETPGKSKVTVTFGLSNAENISSIILHVNHCRTTADGIVNVALNGTIFLPTLRAPRDNFGMETFRLQANNLRPQGNVLTIQLDSSSPGVYWLSDAEICIERPVNQKGNLPLTVADPGFPKRGCLKISVRVALVRAAPRALARAPYGWGPGARRRAPGRVQALEFSANMGLQDGRQES